MSNTDLYIRDKTSGHVHRIGDDPHDSLWVDHEGTVHYMNLQCGDGAGPYSQMDHRAGFEFVSSVYGVPEDGSTMEEAEKYREDREKFREKQAKLAEKGIVLLS